MHQSLIEQLSQQIKIAPLNIIREYLEMEVMHNLSQTDLSTRIIFYGGTALRLAYGSFRFSEDLDFLFLRHYQKDKKILKDVLTKTASENPGLKVEQVYDKRYTLFGLLHIKNPILKHPIRLKIEITKKKNGLKAENLLLISPVSTLEPIIKTATMESLQKTKISAIKNRNQTRDWFDLWYLNQKLKQDFKPSNKFPFNPLEFKNELKRWLPRDKWIIINTALSYYYA